MNIFILMIFTTVFNILVTVTTSSLLKHPKHHWINKRHCKKNTNPTSKTSGHRRHGKNHQNIFFIFILLTFTIHPENHQNQGEHGESSGYRSCGKKNPICYNILDMKNIKINFKCNFCHVFFILMIFTTPSFILMTFTHPESHQN